MFIHLYNKERLDVEISVVFLLDSVVSLKLLLSVHSLVFIMQCLVFPYGIEVSLLSAAEQP